MSSHPKASTAKPVPASVTAPHPASVAANPPPFRAPAHPIIPAGAPIPGGSPVDPAAVPPAPLPPEVLVKPEGSVVTPGENVPSRYDDPTKTDEENARAKTLPPALADGESTKLDAVHEGQESARLDKSGD